MKKEQVRSIPARIFKIIYCVSFIGFILLLTFIETKRYFYMQSLIQAGFTKWDFEGVWRQFQPGNLLSFTTLPSVLLCAGVAIIDVAFFFLILVLLVATFAIDRTFKERMKAILLMFPFAGGSVFVVYVTLNLFNIPELELAKKSQVLTVYRYDMDNRNNRSRLNQGMQNEENSYTIIDKKLTIPFYNIQNFGSALSGGKSRSQILLLNTKDNVIINIMSLPGSGVWEPAGIIKELNQFIDAP